MLSLGGLEALIVVSLVVVAPILAPVVLNDLLYRDELANLSVLVDVSKDLEPGENCP